MTNPQGLREIFRGDVPSLDAVDVHDFLIDREGPTLRIRLDLRTFPADPPVKWRRSGFNTVQVELLFGGISNLSLEGVSVDMVADVNIRRDVKIALAITSPTVRVTATSASVTISRIAGYVNGERSGTRPGTVQ
ncbi:Imm50 family immunity protein [Micromonospora sp. CA-111912]|uniref:Imm50 family immunity protein n=1 Tax=Micromonospora sp. CA-111912 TaxID=3239955 RepID=UPI003D8D5108